MNKYVYPALFEPGESKGYLVTFPDLPGCITEGKTLEEALYNAKEVLELHLYGMEQDNDLIPAPSLKHNIKYKNNCFVYEIEAWMNLIRDEFKNKSIKKTLTIPKWLNDEAEKYKINFSQLLQTALKERLNIKDNE